MKAKQKFSELSRTSQFAILSAISLQLSLLVTALVDLSKREPAQINGSKGLWAVASFINFIGPLAYFIFGRKKSTK